MLTVGFVTAWALAGCGGGGNASSALSTRTSAVSRDASTVDQPPTTTQARPDLTVTRTQTVQTQTIETPTVATQTVQQTVIAPPVTTSQTSSSSGTPAWVWILIAAGGVGLIALIAWLISSRHAGPSPEERKRLGSAAIESWVAQGWAIESQTEDSTVMRRNGERTMLSVDAQGHVTSLPLRTSDPLAPPSGERWPDERE